MSVSVVVVVDKMNHLIHLDYCENSRDVYRDGDGL